MIIHSTKLDTMNKVIAIYGGTTWVKIEGRFLLGQSSSYAINSTGGEATHTLIVNEMPSHNHAISSIFTKAGSQHLYVPAIQSSGYSFAHNIGDITIGNTGGGKAHNNMPPYKTVYIWERTA